MWYGYEAEVLDFHQIGGFGFSSNGTIKVVIHGMHSVGLTFTVTGVLNPIDVLWFVKIELRSLMQITLRRLSTWVNRWTHFSLHVFKYLDLGIGVILCGVISTHGACILAHVFNYLLHIFIVFFLGHKNMFLAAQYLFLSADFSVQRWILPLGLEQPNPASSSFTCLDQDQPTAQLIFQHGGYSAKHHLHIQEANHFKRTKHSTSYRHDN